MAWKNFYRVWMEFVNDYKNMGGRVTVGSDSGFIYQLYGFGTILEMEMLQEAGFHPLEVIRSATMYGAQALFEPKRRGHPVRCHSPGPACGPGHRQGKPAGEI